MSELDSDPAENSPTEVIQRDNEVAILTNILKEPPTEKVVICSVSGTGGVGKTFLVDHVLEGLNLEGSGYLRLSADGLSPQLRADFIGLLDQKILPRTLHKPARSGKDYFPGIREIADAYSILLNQVNRELAVKENSILSPVRAMIPLLLKAGQVVNKLSPHSRGFFDFGAISVQPKELESLIAKAGDVAKGLSALEIAQPKYLPRSVRGMIGMTLRRRIKYDLYGLTADYLCQDLRKFVRKKTDSRLGIGSKKVIFDKLLLIFDDYEILGPVISDFIFNALVPRLKNEDFNTTVILIGRDDFSASDPDYSFTYKHNLRAQIRLEPFTEQQAFDYMNNNKVDHVEAQNIYTYSGGFPFLLQLMVKWRGAMESADIPRQFYDRTVRWMSPTEVNWFGVVVYLDKVNTDTLSWFFPEDEVEQIQYWFERDGSVRDPKAKAFSVNGIIRQQVMQYFGVRNPTRHTQMLEKVKRHLTGGVTILDGGNAKQPAAKATHLHPSREPIDSDNSLGTTSEDTNRRRKSTRGEVRSDK